MVAGDQGDGEGFVAQAREHQRLLGGVVGEVLAILVARRPGGLQAVRVQGGQARDRAAVRNADPAEIALGQEVRAGADGTVQDHPVRVRRKVGPAPQALGGDGRVEGRVAQHRPVAPDPHQACFGGAAAGQNVHASVGARVGDDLRGGVDRAPGQGQLALESGLEGGGVFRGIGQSRRGRGVGHLQAGDDDGLRQRAVGGDPVEAALARDDRPGRGLGAGEPGPGHGGCVHVQEGAAVGGGPEVHHAQPHAGLGQLEPPADRPVGGQGGHEGGRGGRVAPCPRKGFRQDDGAVASHVEGRGAVVDLLPRALQRRHVGEAPRLHLARAQAPGLDPVPGHQHHVAAREERPRHAEVAAEVPGQEPGRGVRQAGPQVEHVDVGRAPLVRAGLGDVGRRDVQEARAAVRREGVLHPDDEVGVGVRHRDPGGKGRGRRQGEGGRQGQGRRDAPAAPSRRHGAPPASPGARARCARSCRG